MDNVFVVVLLGVLGITSIVIGVVYYFGKIRGQSDDPVSYLEDTDTMYLRTKWPKHNETEEKED